MYTYFITSILEFLWKYWATWSKFVERYVDSIAVDCFCNVCLNAFIIYKFKCIALNYGQFSMYCTIQFHRVEIYGSIKLMCDEALARRPCDSC